MDMKAANNRIERHKQAQNVLRELVSVVWHLNNDDTNENMEDALALMDSIEGSLNVSQDLAQEELNTGREFDYPGNDETPNR